MAEVVLHHGGSLPLRLGSGDDFLAGSQGWPPQNDNSNHVSHCCAQHSARCWLQGKGPHYSSDSGMYIILSVGLIKKGER